MGKTVDSISEELGAQKNMRSKPVQGIVFLLRILEKNMDFRSGCWLIGGMPKNLLILGDHLFLNYKKKIGKFLLINRVVLLILTWH